MKTHSDKNDTLALEHERLTSLIGSMADGVIAGLGGDGYELAIQAVAQLVRKSRQGS